MKKTLSQDNGVGIMFFPKVICKSEKSDPTMAIKHIYCVTYWGSPERAEKSLFCESLSPHLL